MPEQPYFDDVTVGDVLAPQEHAIGAVQMFLFSSATNNAHRIHYDYRWATEVEGHRDIVVHGPLQAALMAKMLTDWAGPRGQLVRISVRNQRTAFAGELLVFTAEVVRKYHDGDRALIDLRLAEKRDGMELLMPGNATLRLPTRREGGTDKP
jgi:acyl dehydratase